MLFETDATSTHTAIKLEYRKLQALRMLIAAQPIFIDETLTNNRASP